MTLKVGLIVGREWSFPPAFIEEVNRRDEGVTAEYVKLGAPRMDEPCEYAVIIDRISHEVPFYRTYLKQAAVQGCTVVNNPFMWSADDKFFGAALATSLGIAHPRTVVLPNREYIPGIIPEESLRNLQYPLDWQGVVDYVGLPCVLKDAHGGGWKDVYICRSLDELIHHYNTSGLLTMVVQEFIKWDHFVRCICLGQEEILPIRYDPGERRYHVDHAHMSEELGRRVVEDSRKLVQALGYDMNSMEWAIKDGVPYAIDFMNPAPDMDYYSLTEHYFRWVVEHMADMAIRLAKNPRPQAAALRWDGLFAGRRQMQDAIAASPAVHAATLSGGSWEGADAGTSGSGEDDGRGGYLIGGGRSGEAGGGGAAEARSGDAAPSDGDDRGGYLIGGGRSGEAGGGGAAEARSGDAAPSDGDGRGGYLIGGGRSGESGGGAADDARSGGANPADDDGRGGYLIGGGRSGESGGGVTADGGEASTAGEDGGYLIGGGRSGEGGGTPDGGEAGTAGEDGGYLIGGGRSGESGTASDDPGDAPDRLVDEQASEGHA